ncbi:radical SAM/CxCxxxxC motif protein YfkAB [Microaerobacter geothermalis]|uniref:radical SAM/CxCxxxxC motif protein YfkAB n=1 Tax=Microaerobacter geothermalis TaxID=674972 RepID=UPI001F1C7B84|nr:radical SAM/CxCxxxxC motif protein YfkAB [Microaerobacter geothermalis]MCF6093629.1 radical SAM/CxCxxxxC motif protein YfkAB [Microaerobacter geothermalis]
MNISLKQPITTMNDPWEAYTDVIEWGELVLSNIEFTTTNICNMRCKHCAVGNILTSKDPKALPIELILKRLDEIPNLRALSITGGEPMLSAKGIENYVLPILKYAHERGVRTQLNSNLTLDLEKYEEILPFIDVLHISHNWGTLAEFADVGFFYMETKPTLEQIKKYYDRMFENSRALAERGVFVSAETMLNQVTIPHLEKIHREVVYDMKCQRHEIHPMYSSDFAASLAPLSLSELREAIHHLLDIRNPNTWMLFGTLPFYACSDLQEDHQLLKRLYESPNVTVRNDPDGRSRLNVNIFSGDVIITDFGDPPPLGNIQRDSLVDLYEKWKRSSLAKQLICHCPSVKCLGPNILVKNDYYPNTNFQERSAKTLSC